MFTIINFLFFTALVAVLTYWITRKSNCSSTEGYFLANRSLSAGFIAGSLMLTNLSTEQLVGLNGSAFLEGLSVMAWEIGACIALVLMALFFLPIFLKSGITTVPEFLEERFGPSTRMITTAIFILAYTFILLPIILYSGAMGLSTMLNIGALTGIENDQAVLWLTVVIVGCIGSFYAIFGGLRSIAVSDTINGVGLLVGGLMITFFGLNALGGDHGLLGGWHQLMAEHPERMNSIAGKDQSLYFPTLFTGFMLLHIFYWCTNQQIIQRTLGAKNLAEGQKGVLLAGFLKLLGPSILVLPGIIAFHLYHRNGIAADAAYGTLVRETLPAGLTGFFAATMVGAILSSFNSALNSTATLFSLGVYKTMIRRDATHHQIVSSGKWCSFFVAIFAMVTAPMLAGQESIFTYLQAMNAIYFIPLLAIIITGIVEKRTSAKAANIALGIGLVVMILESFFFQDAVESHLNRFHFIAIVFFGTLATAILLGRRFPRSTPYVQSTCHEISLKPWAYSKITAVGLLVAVVSLYLAFADFSVL